MPETAVGMRQAITATIFSTMLVGGAAASSDCETWCSHPCTELNGSPEMECGGCAEPMLCRPGEPGFAKTNANGQTVLPQAKTSPADSRAGGAYGTHGNPLKMPDGYFDSFVTGACDLESVDHAEVTREMLMAAKKPFMIKGMTDDWKAHTTWAKDEMLRLHSGEPFQLHANNNASLGDLLAWNGKYHMGHAVYPPTSCYSDPWRPYSPMLRGALKDDYYLPRYLGPMVTFQMGVGSGYGIGVSAPGYSHCSSTQGPGYSHYP